MTSYRLAFPGTPVGGNAELPRAAAASALA